MTRFIAFHEYHYDRVGVIIPTYSIPLNTAKPC